jgi:hypothetical protein
MQNEITKKKTHTPKTITEKKKHDPKENKNPSH